MPSEPSLTIARNASDASGTYCPCGCGREVVKKRPWQKYYSDQCRRRAHRKDCLNREKLALVRSHLNEALEILAELEKG